MLRINVTLVSDGLSGGLESDAGGLAMQRRLKIYLRPFRLPNSAEFVMEMLAADKSSGGRFTVLATPVGADQYSAVIEKFKGPEDVGKCLAALRSGKDLFFTLRDENEPLVRLPLPNDGEFRRLYDDACNRMAETEVARLVLRSQANKRVPTGIFSKLFGGRRT